MKTINADALRKDIEHLYSVYAENKDWFYTDVLNHIDNAPTVEPERPKGKWIYQPNHTHLDNVQKYHCSTNICGRQQNYKSKFCPNCGADMRGEKK